MLLSRLQVQVLAERHEQTLARIEQLTSAGYTVKVQWECEFEGVADDLRRHPIVRHAPMNTRDALYEGRTEAMRLHYKIKEGEESVQ
jgi:G:T-mismatch repair DNA endonuclease (very short patch repair protein)